VQRLVDRGGGRGRHHARPAPKALQQQPTREFCIRRIWRCGAAFRDHTAASSASDDASRPLVAYWGDVPVPS
jgi:hypothetical protein